MAKGYNLAMDYVLYEMSYANMVMYGAVLPGHGRKKGDEKDNGTINADDPENRDRARGILFGEP